MNHLTNRLKSLRQRRRDMKKRRGEEGFTLIELMVVVLIMGILAAIAIPTFLGAKNGAQNSQVTSNLRNLLTDQATAYASNGAYASDTVLEGLDPTYAKDLTAGTIVDKVAASGVHPDWTCMYETSSTGTIYGIGSLSNGSGAGTYYYESTGGTAPGCTGAFTATGWSTTASASGF